jgi:capsular exopolysaccharide synthesis family protein
MASLSALFAIHKAPPPRYRSVCSIKFEKEIPVEGIYAKTISWSPENDIKTQMSLIKSYAVIQKVAEKLGKIPEGISAEELRQKPHIAKLITRLRSRVEVSRDRKSTIINIKAVDKHPAFAQRLANETALTYKELHVESQNKRTSRALEYLNEELKKTRRELRDAEDEFNRFTQENQLVSFDLQGENLLQRVKLIKDKIRELIQAEAEISDLIVKLKIFINRPTGSGESFYSTYTNKQFQNANNVLIELLLKRNTLLEDFTPNHPSIIAVRRKIVANAKKMSIIASSQNSKIRKDQDLLKKELQEVEQKINELMEKKLKFNRLKRKVDSCDAAVNLLEKKNQEALLRKAEKPEEVTIVKPAFLPSSPINLPKIYPITATGVVIGLVLGMIAAFILETLDASLGDVKEVEDTLGTKVLGIIPQRADHEAKELFHYKDQIWIRNATYAKKVHLASHFSPKSPMAESFRALRINMHFSDMEKKAKTLAIASATPQEGKTVVSVNLSISLAQAGKKTLLVGADLRKPTVSEAFGIENNPGLTDILLGNYSWRDAIKTVTDIMIGEMTLKEVMITPGLDNLHIITAGTMTSNPAELIDSGLLVNFIEEVKKEYDFIVFDTSPVLSTADMSILGTKLDAVLLVYRLGITSRELLKRTGDQLSQVNSNIIGVVLNGIRAGMSQDFQDFKAYNYYYFEDHNAKGSKTFGLKKMVAMIKGKTNQRMGSKQQQAKLQRYGERSGGEGRSIRK